MASATAVSPPATAPSVKATPPPIDLSESRYDLNTYLGRVQHMFAVTNPLKAFVSDEKLERSKKLLADYNAGNHNIPEEQLWEAKQVVDSVLHPDTGKPVPFLFRGSTFVLTNVVICFGMLLPSAGVATTIFWQWLNQSYNAMFNYSNKNATVEMDTSAVMKAYSAAVLTSCGLAVAGSKLLKRAQTLSPATRSVLSAVIPFGAVAAAGVANVSLMRANEAIDGVDVTDDKGEKLGKSVAAGRRVVGVMALSRVALPIPILLGPPLVMNLLERTPFLRNHPAGTARNTVVKLTVVGAALWVALPLAVGLFPQKLPIPVSKLEPELQAVARKRAIDTVFVNKGV